MHQPARRDRRASAAGTPCDRGRRCADRRASRSGAASSSSRVTPPAPSRARLAVAVDHLQADRVGVEIGQAGQVARLQPDRADAQRRAVREGDGGGGVRGVHGGGPFCSRPLYWGACAWDNGRPQGIAPARACRAGMRSGLAGHASVFADVERVASRYPPLLISVSCKRFSCPSIPPPSAVSRIWRASRSPTMRSSTCRASSTPCWRSSSSFAR